MPDLLDDNQTKQQPILTQLNQQARKLTLTNFVDSQILLPFNLMILSSSLQEMGGFIFSLALQSCVVSYSMYVLYKDFHKLWIELGFMNVGYILQRFDLPKHILWACIPLNFALTFIVLICIRMGAELWDMRPEEPSPFLYFACISFANLLGFVFFYLIYHLQAVEIAEEHLRKSDETDS